MATDKYDPSPENVGNVYMHLTNPDINKHRPNHPYVVFECKAREFQSTHFYYVTQITIISHRKKIT